MLRNVSKGVNKSKQKRMHFLFHPDDMVDYSVDRSNGRIKSDKV